MLEDLINKTLLPTYHAYFKLANKPEPELDVLTISLVKKKQIPVLLKKK
jgi:hypothetical protein